LRAILSLNTNTRRFKTRQEWQNTTYTIFHNTMNTTENQLRAIHNPYDTCDIHCLKSIDMNKGKATNKPTTPNRIEREYEKPLANIMPHGVPYSVPEMNRARGRKLRRQEPDHNPNSSLICNASNGSLLAY
jgi:hypothetical protein